MNYTEALEYIHGISWTFCKPGLERISELCEKLGHPERELKFIHIAGTNGKGSTSVMLAAVLREADYKVGLYTSPYVTVFNERMRINGENITDEELATITSELRPIADSMTDKPTEFELITAIAFEYFRRNNCDIVVLEAGMGGRLDSTNVIEDALLSIITGIALDHVAFLGDTVEKIAFEKAGIIKPSCPVIFGGDDPAAESVISARAASLDAPYMRTDHSQIKIKSSDLGGTLFDFGDYKDIKIRLLGSYQPSNASTVLCAIDALRKRGVCISDEALRKGLLEARWPARFEIIADDPTVIFDGAHNAQGIAAATRSIKLYFGDKKVKVLTGVLSDKDYEAIAGDIAQVCDCAFTITPDNPRALSAEDYAAVLARKGVYATACASINEALSLAIKDAKISGSPLVCLGSLYTYSSIKNYFNAGGPTI